MGGMQVRPRWIPGMQGVPVRVASRRTTPDRVRLHLSVDEYGVTRGPIHRGDGPPYMLKRRGASVMRITDPALMRSELMPVVGEVRSHLSLFAGLYPRRRPLAVTGCGNLGMNPGVLAALPDGRVGTLGPYGGAIHVEPDGSGRGLDELPSGPRGFAVSGPRLVRKGRPLPPRAETFADPRHLLLFPYVQVRRGVRIDLGLDLLLASEDLKLYRDAVEGSLPVRIPLETEVVLPPGGSGERMRLPIDGEAVRRALDVKGYRESALGEPGTYRLAPDSLEISFLPGIYPHHVLAVDVEGAVHSILVSGASNRAGVRVRELAEDLAAAGFQEAILLDNGGDVGLYLPREGRFEIQPAEPDRARVWPLSACLVFFEESPGL